MSDRFAPQSSGDVADLVRHQPLCWIVSRGDDPRGSVAPLLVRCDDAGAVIGFEGHLARSNPQLAVLMADPHALVLCLGPNGYIAASWMQDRDWAPTWNFAQGQFSVTLEFFEGAAEVEAHLTEMVTVMEAGRPGAWSIEEMGQRFHGVARGVVGFRATIDRADSRFKLGQDERDGPYADILKGLGDGDLSAWMQRFNPDRPETDSACEPTAA